MRMRRQLLLTHDGLRLASILQSNGRRSLFVLYGRDGQPSSTADTTRLDAALAPCQDSDRKSRRDSIVGMTEQPQHHPGLGLGVGLARIDRGTNFYQSSCSVIECCNCQRSSISSSSMRSRCLAAICCISGRWWRGAPEQPQGQADVEIPIGVFGVAIAVRIAMLVDTTSIFTGRPISTTVVSMQ